MAEGGVVEDVKAEVGDDTSEVMRIGSSLFYY